MANEWFRLWHDMANDPKWRTIARVSKQEISRVIAIAVHMMTCASKATNRGHTEGWCDEDIATALDIETSDVVAVREAMQGRILDGDYLTGWGKRQPKREREDDNSTERVKQYRARQLEFGNAAKHNETPCNANKSQETHREDKDKDKEEEEIKPKTLTAPQSVALLVSKGVEQQVAKDWVALRNKKRLASTQTAFDGFFEEVEKSGMQLPEVIRLCCKKGWAGFEAEWLNKPQARASPPYQTKQDKAKDWADRATGRRNEQPHIIDIDEIPTNGVD